MRMFFPSVPMKRMRRDFFVSEAEKQNENRLRFTFIGREKSPVMGGKGCERNATSTDFFRIR